MSPDNPGILSPGTIVWAHLKDPRGAFKKRPVLILVDTNYDSADALMRCAAITTTFPNPAPSTCVELPWNPSGKVATGLRKRSAVVLDWVFRVRPQQLDEVVGYITPKLLQTILTKISQMPEI